MKSKKVALEDLDDRICRMQSMLDRLSTNLSSMATTVGSLFAETQKSLDEFRKTDTTSLQALVGDSVLRAVMQLSFLEATDSPLTREKRVELFEKAVEYAVKQHIKIRNEKEPTYDVESYFDGFLEKAFSDGFPSRVEPEVRSKSEAVIKPVALNQEDLQRLLKSIDERLVAALGKIIVKESEGKAKKPGKKARR